MHSMSDFSFHLKQKSSILVSLRTGLAVVAKRVGRALAGEGTIEGHIIHACSSRRTAAAIRTVRRVLAVAACRKLTRRNVDWLGWTSQTAVQRLCYHHDGPRPSTATAGFRALAPVCPLPQARNRAVRKLAWQHVAGVER